VNFAVKFKDAQRLIKEGRPKDACGVLRPVLEKHLKTLCSEKKVCPSNTNISNMIHALSEEGAIDSLERNRFMTWKNLGNAGSHEGQEEVKQIDAEYFLAGLADVVGATLDQRTESAVPSSMASSLPKPAARARASGSELHRQALISAFYLSKFDHNNLRLGNQGETFSAIAKVLSVKVNTLKNYRDLFDSHTGSYRKGWRVEMSPQFAEIFQKFKDHDELILRTMVLGFIGK
jgi:hypothetical protein